MIDKFERNLYGQHWFMLHGLVSLLLTLVIYFFMKLCGLEFEKLLTFINENTVSLSATIAGFVFAGMSIFISMEGSKKMSAIKLIEKDHIIYNILISSITFFMISLFFMLARINLFNISSDQITYMQNIVKLLVEWISLYGFLLGFIYFFSSLKLIYWIFK